MVPENIQAATTWPVSNTRKG